MSKLIIAEKPSVAKSIASALDASSRADGFYEGSGLLVSWCVGHLVSPMDAGGYDERFKKWRYDDLPILPEPFRYVLALGKEDAFENLCALMDRPDVDTICFTGKRQVCSASEDRQEKAARSIRQRKQRNEKRTDELTRLIRKLYEDNVSGRLSDTLFEQMLRDFEAELSDLTEIVSQDQQELERISRETINAEKFLSLVRKYTDFSELTPAMINEFVEKILVHQAQGKGASRIQEIEIFFNFVGKVDIPHKEVELTEEEKAALAEQERRRAKKAEYNRRYMEKKRRQWKEQQEQEQAEQLPLAAEQKGEHIA